MMKSLKLTYDGDQHATALHVDTITVASRVPRDFAFTDRLKMERAAELCPIKHSFGKDAAVTAAFDYDVAKAA